MNKNGGYNYSIDKLRLQCKVSIDEFTKLEFLFNSVYKNRIKTYYNSYDCREYRYNYVITVGESNSFYFAYLHNTEKLNLTKDKFNFVLEFNPNKCKDDELLLKVMYFFKDYKNWVVKAYDIAVDIPINILSIAGFDKGRKRDVRVFNNGGDDLTIYCGKKGSISSLKIYNKARESNLNEELTRVEYHIIPDDLNFNNYQSYISNFILIDLYKNDYLTSDLDNDRTLSALIYAVNNGFNIHDLSRAYKTKVKQALDNTDHHLHIYRKEMDRTLKQTITKYRNRAVRDDEVQLYPWGRFT